jgi:glycosyltransferase involved in cell wall biosynthesis
LDGSKPTVALYFSYEFIPGGGEKFGLSIAEQFSDEAEIVLIFESQQSILRVMSVVTDLGFSTMNFKCITLKEALARPKFDVFILQGNELFPTKKALGRRNYFVCQFPHPVPVDYLLKYESLGIYKDYDCYIVYSEYVKKHVKTQLDTWRRNDITINIISPTADDIGLGDAEKTNQIIGVGRFFTGGHNKRHDIMIDALESILEKDPNIDLHLCLVGASHKEAQHREHLVNLREKANGLPVEFYVDELRENLNDLYRKSKIYYHAGGWGVDERENPSQAEHFGISVIEAMSAGCIPIVYALGGPIEIVNHGISGIAVGSVAEMVDWTLRILRGWDSPMILEMRKNAFATAKAYGKEAFGQRVRDVVKLDRPAEG